MTEECECPGGRKTKHIVSWTQARERNVGQLGHNADTADGFQRVLCLCRGLETFTCCTGDVIFIPGSRADTQGFEASSILIPMALSKQIKGSPF